MNSICRETKFVVTSEHGSHGRQPTASSEVYSKVMTATIRAVMVVLLCVLGGRTWNQEQHETSQVREGRRLFLTQILQYTLSTLPGAMPVSPQSASVSSHAWNRDSERLGDSTKGRVPGTAEVITQEPFFFHITFISFSAPLPISEFLN